MVIVGITGWIVTGLLIGFIASKVVNLRGDDPKLGICAAAVGAIVGAILHSVITKSGVSGFNLWTIISAAVGATVAVVIWHIVRSRFVSHETYAPRRSY